MIPDTPEQDVAERYGEDWPETIKKASEPDDKAFAERIRAVAGVWNEMMMQAGKYHIEIDADMADGTITVHGIRRVEITDL